MSLIQKIIKFFVSARTFSKIKLESEEWYFKCDCGNEFSVWDTGGIRYKAKGNPLKAARCTKCNKIAVRKLYKR